ncbi:MAG: metallophosphoesterase [Myxococcota bacterium]
MAQDSIFFVGDVQGCASALERLLKKAGYSPDRHRLIPLGDTINRGPENVRTLQCLQSLGAEPILGNHELKLLEALETHHRPEWMARQTVSKDLLIHPACDALLSWIRAWPGYRTGKDWIAVHGGLHPTLPVEATPLDFLAFVRICDAQGKIPKKDSWDGFNETIPPGFKPWYSYYSGEKKVFYGHWARQGLVKTHRTLGLDTGCVYGLSLTGCWYPSGELVHVPAQE